VDQELRKLLDTEMGVFGDVFYACEEHVSLFFYIVVLLKMNWNGKLKHVIY